MTWVVVGNGIVSQRFCARLAESGLTRHQRVLVFGEEPVPAYDRVQLTRLFGPDTALADLTLAEPGWYAARGIELHLDEPVEKLDVAAQRITTARRELEYERVILATGSEALRPDVPGATHPDVRVYRSVADLEAIRDAVGPGASVGIVGAGLLGIELAAALRQRGARVCLLERAPRMMPRQLDPSASAVLDRQVRRLGIDVECGQRLLGIEVGDGRARLDFEGSVSREYDRVVIAAGVRPRDSLARAAGLDCHPRGGVRVDDGLATSDPAVFAIGECAVHDDVAYGLVAPGHVMAETLAARFDGDLRARFTGMPFATRLKLDSVDVSVIGDSAATHAEARVLEISDGEVYRRVVLRRGRVEGATAVGDWPELSRVQEAMASGRVVRTHHERRFRRTGTLWGDAEPIDVTQWPDAATLCTCTGVTCGRLRLAVAAGHDTPESLARETGASTVCGSCAPLVAQFAGAGPERVRVRGAAALVLGSVAALVAATALVLFAPERFRDTVQGSFALDALWRDSLPRQITGFSLLGLCAIAAILPLRKRISRIRLGEFSGWRVVHTLVGAGAVAAAVLHTGLRLGHNLNFALMCSFLAVSTIGAAASLVTAAESRLPVHWAGRLRRGWTLAHILVLAPFPVLLGFHVLKVYYF